MQNVQAGQPSNVANIGGKKDLPPADGWLKLKILPKATDANPKPKPLQITRDVPLSVKSLVSRSMINAEKAHQDENPGAEPLEFDVVATINIPGQNDDKEDFIF